MTHRVQPVRSKIEDLPLSASIECLDPPEQSQFSTHTTDLLSNIHHNIYSSKIQKNFGSPEIESQFGTQSIQQIMSGMHTPSNLDSISREIQIPQSITAIHSLQATHSRHNSRDFFLTTGHSPSKNFLNTEKVINTNFSKLDSFSSTLPVRNLRDIDTEKDYESENILKERRTENARKTVSYKNFGIKHDDDQKPLNITPLGQPDLNQVDEAEQTQETEETERRNHHSLPTRAEGFSRIEKRALSKNPVIGKMINESSKELDRINKMLENHRQKNAKKKMFQDTIENSYAQRNSEKFHPSEIRPMDEGQSGPSEIYLQTDGQENSLENMMAGPQELEPKYTEQLSGDFFTDRLDDHFYKDDIENVLEGELEEEQLERELGLDDLESRRHDDLMMMEEEMIFKEEKMMKGGKKKMNKLQKDFEVYRASNPPKGSRMTATDQQNNKHYMNKIAIQNKRNGQGKVSKENYAPPPVLNLKPVTKKNPPQGFHSIDMSNQSIEHPSKKYPFKNFSVLMNSNRNAPKATNNNNKDKGSYAKKFLEYKERRKQQNQLPRQTETVHPEGTPQKSSRSSNSERKTQQQRLTYNNREDSLPLTDRSSARKKNLNTPQASARQRSRTQGPGQNAQETKNIQLMRYCDIRNAHKSNQKQAPAVQRESVQPINRLELDRLRENKEDDRKPSSRAANPATAVTNGNGNSVSANLIKPILVISDHKSRRPSIERAQTFRDNGKKEAEMDIPDYQKEILRGQPINPEEIMRETHQIYSSASSTKNSRVTQESLMKSLKLRQEMFSKAFGGGGKNPRRGGSGQIDFKDYESHGRIGAVGDLGMTAPIMREKKRDEEIYNKNIEWLNSRQRKLNKMHNKEMEDEMRECTFKPQLLTKELNLKLEYESEINLPRSRERNNQGSFSRNIPVAEQR